MTLFAAGLHRARAADRRFLAVMTSPPTLPDQAALEALAAEVGALLLANGQKLAIAESCTGGWVRSKSSSARARSCAWAKAASIDDIQVVSTGSLGLDIALGIGGLPRGRVVEIYGPESSGKTTLTLQVIAEMQKPAAPPPSSTPSTRSTGLRRRKLGVNVDDLLISQPDTGEQALEIADMLVRSGASTWSSSTRSPR
jgi:hypothetical protein